MATNFPASLDTLTNPSATDTLDSPPHDEQHADANDAIEALQAKVGVDSSAVTSSHDYKIADHASRLSSLEAISHGKILQVVRATDSTRRTTTSTSYVDTGLSVTITPTDSANDILLLWFYNGRVASSGVFLLTQITDNSNNAISGAEGTAHGATSVAGLQVAGALAAFDSPATTSATTYKARYRADSAGTVEIMNNQSTGQLYAIEVSA